jgi:hypothetical protein
VQYGEAGDQFYIILKGIVSVQIPNPKIKNWRMKRLDFILDYQWITRIESDYIKAKSK